jgi:hypothetical protein
MQNGNNQPILEIPSPKDKVAELFHLLGVSRVVVVDDRFSNEPTIEVALASVKVLLQTGLLDALQEWSLTVEMPENVVDETVRSRWEGLNSIQKSEWVARWKTALPLPQETEDSTDNPDTIKNVFSDLKECESKFLKPTDWEKVKNQLINEANAGKKTLFLFDQDQSHDRGTTQSGQTQLYEILKEGNPENSLCGLLSHTFDSEGEVSIRKRICEELKLDKAEQNRFITIAKDNLSKPSELVNKLRLTGLGEFASKLKLFAQNTLRDAQDSAYKFLDDIDVIDFEHIVLNTSESEGIWEIDTLFRLFSVHHRHTSMKSIIANEEVRSVLQKLQHLRSIEKLKTSKLSAEVHLLRTLEMYEEGELLNARHAPIDLGDIFKTDSNEYFVLIGAPCDLMLRANKARNAGSGLLAPIKTNGKLLANQLESHFAIHQILDGADVTSDCFVDFKGAEHIPLEILDFCSFKPDGRAIFKLDEPTPERLIKPLIRQYESHRKTFNDKITLLKPFNDEISAQIISDPSKKLLPALLHQFLWHSKLIPGELDFQTSVLTYPVQRIKRLNSNVAYALLIAYTKFISRPAFDPDFTRLK